MKVFNKAGSKKRLFEMMAVINKTPINEKFLTKEELGEIASLYKAKKQTEDLTHDQEPDLNDTPLNQSNNDENKNFDLLKTSIIKDFNPEIIHDDDHEFQIRIPKDNNYRLYKIVKFYIKNDENAPLYGIYKYDDSFDGYDLLHDEIGSRALDSEQIPLIISQDLKK